jgi:hypothetical protein
MPSVSQGTHAMRRGGARQTVSDRVTFRRGPGEQREGWALNVSRGGLRAILDEDTKVELGEEYEIFVGEVEGGTAKRGRIVWLQEEPDGFVVGVEYVGVADASGENPTATPPSSPPSTETPETD